MVISWAFSCLDSIPFYLLAAGLALATQSIDYGLHITMVSIFWTSCCKSIRGQTIKLKNHSYVEAAKSLGANDGTILLNHIFPNVTHIVTVEIGECLVAAIKTEALLSFLGLGYQGSISWGMMLSEASNEVLVGFYNNFLSSSLFMIILVLSIHQLVETLQKKLFLTVQS